MRAKWPQFANIVEDDHTGRRVAHFAARSARLDGRRSTTEIVVYAVRVRLARDTSHDRWATAGWRSALRPRARVGMGRAQAPRHSRQTDERAERPADRRDDKADVNAEGARDVG